MGRRRRKKHPAGGRRKARSWVLGLGAWGLGLLRSAFRLPLSAFRLPLSAFRLPLSAFRLPLSAFRLPPSTFLVIVFLVLAVAAVFGQTLAFQFVNFDDDQYVTENPQVVRGLSGAGLAWAVTARYASNWHPLTWLSHALDCQIYGLRPWGHHLSSVLLHAAAAILLFLALRRMTGAVWLSAWVAAVFAIHPLRVESVAWVAERKDVLSGLFFMLTLWLYARYVEKAEGFSKAEGGRRKAEGGGRKAEGEPSRRVSASPRDAATDSTPRRGDAEVPGGRRKGEGRARFFCGTWRW